MTTEELRAIDFDIAKNIMGINLPTWNIYQDQYQVKENPVNIPRYSTDIAAAWEVVENFTGQGFWIEQIGDGFEAGFSGLTSESSFATTAPLAICLAAREIKGINK